MGALCGERQRRKASSEPRPSSQIHRPSRPSDRKAALPPRCGLILRRLSVSLPSRRGLIRHGPCDRWFRCRVHPRFCPRSQRLVGLGQQTLRRDRMLQSRENHAPHPLQCRDIASFKNVRLVRKQLKDTDDVVSVQQGHHHHRRDSQRLAALTIYPGIARCIIAAQSLLRAYALPRESRVHLQLRAHLWRRPACASPAHHLFAVAQRDGRSRSPRDVLSPFCQQLQGGGEILLGHLGKRLSAILARKTQVPRHGRRLLRARTRPPALERFCRGWLGAGSVVENRMWIHQNVFIRLPRWCG